MGTYINIGNTVFLRACNSEYVDKSGLISIVNSTLNTERSYTCVTLCRRLGKSMAAKILYAYYDQFCDSRNLFEGLTIAHDTSSEKYLNKFPVIYLDTSVFVTRFHDDTMLSHIVSELMDADTAIDQIKRKQYPAKLSNYGNLNSVVWNQLRQTKENAYLWC